MESIDALAKAVNEFEGGLVLVSHDMRLISQVAKEIWIGDASVKATDKPKETKKKAPEPKLEVIQPGQSKSAAAKITTISEEPLPAEPKQVSSVPPPTKKPSSTDDNATVTTVGTSGSSSIVSGAPIAAKPKKGSYVPPHLRKKMAEQQ